MDDLERLLCELKARRRAPEPPRPAEKNSDAQPNEDTLTRLGQLEARLRASTPSTPSSLSQDTPPSTDPLSLDWRLLHRQLTQRGLPPLLDDESSPLPRPEDAHAALCSTLAELDRVGRQCEVLQSAAEAAEAREAAALQRAQVEAARRPQEHRELQAAAAQATKEAATAQGATAEAASLRATADRLQRQPTTKDTELRSLQQQLSDLQAHRGRLQAAAQEGLRRIRQALTADRLGLRAIMPPHLTPVQVARAYENQLCIAEEETRAARAEAALLRRRLGCEGIGDAENTSHELARAETAVQEAKEEAEALLKEVERRPIPEEHERLQRELKILTGRLSRLEKQRGGGFATAGTTPWRPPQPPSATQPRDSRDQPSKHVSLELMDTLCGILKASDPLELPAAAREQQRAAAAVPALRRFADEVCAVVFDEGGPCVPWSLRNDDPEDVPVILRAWIRRLQGAERTAKAEEGEAEGEAATDAAVNRPPAQVLKVPAEKGFPAVEIYAAGAPPATPPRRNRLAAGARPRPG